MLGGFGSFELEAPFQALDESGQLWGSTYSHLPDFTSETKVLRVGGCHPLRPRCLGQALEAPKFGNSRERGLEAPEPWQEASPGNTGNKAKYALGPYMSLPCYPIGRSILFEQGVGLKLASYGCEQIEEPLYHQCENRLCDLQGRQHVPLIHTVAKAGAGAPWRAAMDLIQVELAVAARLATCRTAPCVVAKPRVKQGSYG